MFNEAQLFRLQAIYVRLLSEEIGYKGFSYCLFRGIDLQLFTGSKVSIVGLQYTRLNHGSSTKRNILEAVCVLSNYVHINCSTSNDRKRVTHGFFVTDMNTYWSINPLSHKLTENV